MNAQAQNLAESVAADRQALLAVFNSYVFSDTAEDDLQWTEAENTLYHRVAALIEQQQSLAKFIPSAPTQLMELMKELELEETNFSKIQDIIKGDPSLIGEIVKVSNSPMYRPRSGEITSLEKAISMLGLNGILEIASAVMMRNIIDLQSNQFKKPIRKVWTHCLKSAEACQILGDPNRMFEHYLLGLIHDVGRVAIFSCFISQTKSCDLPTANQYSVISRLMKENTAWLSSLIAGEWGLSESYLLTLGEFEKLCEGKMVEEEYAYRGADTKALELGTLSAMIHSLSCDGRIDRDDGIAVLEHSGIESSNITKIFTRFDLADASVG